MDFWSRLIAGVGTPKKSAPSNDPQQRLARFKKAYNQILQVWHKASSLSSDPSATDNIRIGFQRLTSILNDESRSPAPHLCLSFASSSQIYRPIARIASTAHNEAVIREAVAVFAALIDSDEEDFLISKRFSLSLMTFVEKAVGSGLIGEDTESDMVELLFGIAAKIRLQPDILPIWFAATAKTGGDGQPRQKNDFVGMTQKEDFPLCYQLIDHVHHEGRIGDFARTGLLYIFESASKSGDLEQWIVESDLATLMATGLGALYSQLNRKLSILHPPTDMPVILALSDYAELRASSQAESVFSPEFQAHIDTFLSYLAFWQDVLEHCRSVDVRQTLIDHFQVLFLQQLLYPSLLESSDVDGGSSVAVMTYLRRIIDALDHPELMHMILEYLLALQDPMEARAHLPRSPVAAARRESLMLLNEPENEDDRLNPSLFNLVDLIHTGAESTNPQAVIAALKLTTVILSKKHEYAAGTLFKVVDIHRTEPQRTIGGLNAEIDAYLNFAISIAGEAGVDEAYQAHLHDMQKLLEAHPCSLRSLSLTDIAPTIPSDGLQPVKKDVGLHYLIPDDPLLKSLIGLLRRFLTNDVETNLGLTEVMLNLTACSQLRLDGLLAVDPAEYQFPLDETEVDEEHQNIYRARRQPSWPVQREPPVLAAIRSLEVQIQTIRSLIPEFDEHLANRKDAFRIHEEINEAMLHATPVKKPIMRNPSSEASSTSWVAQLDKFVRENSSPPSRSQSPRGRKESLHSRNGSTSSPKAPKFRDLIGVGSPTPRRTREMSPATAPAPTHGALMKDVVGTVASIANSESLQKRLSFTKKPEGTLVEFVSVQEQPTPAPTSSGPPDDTDEIPDTQDASLSHILTNVVILQEFILELVALLQVRANLFSEVKFAE